MVSIEFYPIDITYRVVEGKAMVVMWGVSTDGRRVCVQDHDFEPYFWVVPKEPVLAAEKLAKLKAGEGKEEGRITSVTAMRKNLLGKQVNALKAVADQPQSVPALREVVNTWNKEVSCVLEADIKFVYRYLIDKSITPMTLVKAECEEAQARSKVPVFKAKTIEASGLQTISDQRLLSIDIETYNPEGKNLDAERHPILMIALYGDGFEKVLTWKRFDSSLPGLESLPSEAEMLLRFKELVDEYKPDMIVGYYSDGFDLPYIRTRASKLKVPLEIGLDYSELRVSGRSQTTADTAGIAHIDILPFIRRIIGRSMETDTFTLDAVAAELIGEGKVKVDIEKLAPAWDEDDQKRLAEFAAYNLHDARITHKLAMTVLPNIIEMVKIIGLPPFDVARMTFSQMVEWHIIRQCAAFEELVPNRPGSQESARRGYDRAKGGFVFEPTPGLYRDIAVVDFRSLYPTVIVSHNISPDTINCSCCKNTAKEVPGDGPRIWFCEKKRGLIPVVLEDLIVRRARIKEMIRAAKAPDPLLNARSEGIKVLSNSFYGYLGFAPARWYSHECVHAITAWGRHYITSSIEKAKVSGFKVVYSDTDSVFLQLEGKTKADALAFVEAINKGLPKSMELEYEGFYSAGIFVSTKGAEGGAKKKYALIDDKGRLKIRGFETVRRNWSFIAKDIQKEILEMILRDHDPDKAYSHVKQVIEDLRANKVPLDKVVIFTQIQKDIDSYQSVGPHVAAAQRLKASGHEVRPGTMIKYVVIKGKGKIRDRVKLDTEARQDEYDADYYIENQILPSVDRIFAVLGIDTSALSSKSAKNGAQSSLAAFG